MVKPAMVGDTRGVSPATKQPRPDSTLVAAVVAAREALVAEVGPDLVGEHLGTSGEGERVVSHFFASTSPAYVGWRWSVTLTRAPRYKTITVNEIVLVPSESALTAPQWLPWKDRLGKDDLGPGDLVPVADDDPRLVPGYLVGDRDLDAAEAREIREVTRELGLGRERVLSISGREEAADRWMTAEHGPDASMAKSAPARCGSCGFLVRLAGPLAGNFGVCANASSPSDGQVVSLDHGCGAHSDVRVAQSEHQPSAANPFHDTLTWDDWADAGLELVER